MRKTKRRLRSETERAAWLVNQLLKEEIEERRERSVNDLLTSSFTLSSSEVSADIVHLRTWMQSIGRLHDADARNPQESLSKLTDSMLWDLATEEHHQLADLACAEIAKRGGLIQNWKYLGLDGFHVNFTIETQDPIEEIVHRMAGTLRKGGTIHGEPYALTPYWQPTHVIRAKRADGRTDVFEVMLSPSGAAPFHGEFINQRLSTWHLTEEGWTYEWTPVPDGRKGEHRITKVDVTPYDLDAEDKDERADAATVAKRRRLLIRPALSEVDLLVRELRTKSVRVPELPKKLKRVFTEELSRCLNPHIHEGRVPAYGVALLRDQSLTERASRIVPFSSDRADSMIKLASSERSLVAYDASGKRFLLAFDYNIASEAILVDFSVKTDAVILRRSASNETRIYDKGNVTIHKDRQWSFRGSSEAAVGLAMHQAPMADAQVLSTLLNYAYHELSPSHVGATLVWLLRNSPIEGGHPLGVELNIMRAIDRHLLADYLAQTDGATIVSPEGTIELTGVHLNYTAKAREIIEETGGTRHTSARRFSFDRPEIIVVVVSADGPVSLFSDGCKVATLSMKSFASESVADALRESVPSRAEDVSHGDWEEVCNHCGKTAVINEIVIIGWKEPETARCPVCGKELASAMCFSIDATPLKVLPP